MRLPFDHAQGLIVVPAQAAGPEGLAILQLALDSGATRSLINAGLLVALGYDPAAVLERTEMTTGSGVEFAALVPLQSLVALGRERRDFPVLAHTLPPSAGVDGVLGLDFLRGGILTINFADGWVSLADPAPHSAS